MIRTFATFAFCAFGMTGALAEDEYASPEGKARVAGHYTSFMLATAIEATPSPCPIEGINLAALGDLNKWIDERASDTIQKVYRSAADDAKRLLNGNDAVFGSPAVRREICSELRWEAAKYGLFSSGG